ncbi:stemmadenine O-acetyltransferase-like [Cornus florida]|uniref:stemmadenine O-acetyltransferase-like n=1 Tax=Cornus florida TaxID=4283 RepID=UPI00289E6E76|nr:stemmadenine O-acetyltransferase-like [Cornus florida]
MEVKIVVKERIKPSSPTPCHLRTLKLSLLDHLIPAPYAPILLFYPNPNPNPNPNPSTLNPNHDDDAYASSNSNHHLKTSLALLKESLSQTLTRFYPLAGVIGHDDLSIDCNDEGASYAEAEVNCRLFKFLDHPDLHFINQLLPCAAAAVLPTTPRVVTNIQVNIFQCGGIAIGLCISHRIMDGSALSTFLRSWAATARASSSTNVIYPDFVATSSLFPSNDDLWLRDSSSVMWGSLFKKGKCVTRRFVFESSAIATLKAKATTSATTTSSCPTRVEAVSALIWKCAMAASAQKRGSKRPSLLTHLVNLRTRASPPLSQHSMGNLLWIASAQYMPPAKHDEQQLGLHTLVAQLRVAISKINGDFVKKLRSSAAHINEGAGSAVNIRKSFKKIGDMGSSKQGVDFFGFTSWCKFGFYEVEFGWGKPIWVGGATLGGSSVFMNLNILMETRCGDGIEAWVNLDEQEMDILQHDLELRSYASLDPSPLSTLTANAAAI